MHSLLALLLVAGSFADAIAAAPGDAHWDRFRGPNGTGSVADRDSLPTELDAEHTQWRTPLPPGRSSPVVQGGAVYLTAVDGAALVVLALDRPSGAVLWRREVPRARTTEVDPRNDAASPSACVDAERVVVFFPDAGLFAFDLAGKELWSLPLGPFANLYGMGASPILAGDTVLLALDQNRDSELLAVNAKDGSVRWRTPRPFAHSGHCTPVLSPTEDGKTQVILPGSFYLDAYDLESGERIWWVSGLSFEMKSVPVLHDGVIYLNGYGSPLNQPGAQVAMVPFEEALATRDADHDGRISKDEMPPNKAAAWFDFVDLDLDGSLDATEWTYLRDALGSLNGVLAVDVGGEGDRTADAVRWTFRRSVPQLPSPLLSDGVLYLVDDMGGLLSLLDAKDGTLRERARLEKGQDAYYASPVAGDGKIYLVSETGIVHVLPEGGSLEPRFVRELGELCYATPALDHGQVFLRTEAALYCFAER